MPPCWAGSSFGENGAGMNTWLFWLTTNSRVLGGQPGCLVASSRIRVRAAMSSYGQTWMTWFKGPPPVCQKPPRGEGSVRSGNASQKGSSKFARVGRPGRLFGGLFADPGARCHVLIRPDMDDLVQGADFGVPEGSERRQFRAVRQCLGKALLEFRRGAGVEGIGAHLDDHLGGLPGFGTATLARPAGGDKGRSRQGSLLWSWRARFYSGKAR